MNCEECGALLGEDGLCATDDSDLVFAEIVGTDELLAAAAREVSAQRNRCDRCLGFGHIKTKGGVVKCVCKDGFSVGFERRAPVTPGSSVRVSPSAAARVTDDLDLFIRSKAAQSIPKEELIRAVERVTKRSRATAESAVNKAIGSGLLEVM